MATEYSGLQPGPLKTGLLAVIASLGITESPEAFLGALVLALFGAALGAIWLEHASVRERALTVIAGLFGALLVVLGHEAFLPTWSVQFKALLSGLIGRYLVAFIVQGAGQVVGQSASIINQYLKKLGASDE